jgi:hypothetical protein
MLGKEKKAGGLNFETLTLYRIKHTNNSGGGGHTSRTFLYSSIDFN